MSGGEAASDSDTGVGVSAKVERFCFSGSINEMFPTSVVHAVLDAFVAGCFLVLRAGAGSRGGEGLIRLREVSEVTLASGVTEWIV